MTFYRRNLPHFQRDYRRHFLTFCTRHRWVLPEWARDLVFDVCRYWHGKRYTLYVVVVMPDHVHMIVTPMTDYERMRIYPLRQIMHTIKSYSAHEINRRIGRSGAVWQDESFDHVVRSSESLDAKIAYVLANPVRRGLVNTPDAYSWVWQKPVEYLAEGEFREASRQRRTGGPPVPHELSTGSGTGGPPVLHKLFRLAF